MATTDDQFLKALQGKTVPTSQLLSGPATNQSGANAGLMSKPTTPTSPAPTAPKSLTPPPVASPTISGPSFPGVTDNYDQAQRDVMAFRAAPKPPATMDTAGLLADQGNATTGTPPNTNPPKTGIPTAPKQISTLPQNELDQMESEHQAKIRDLTADSYQVQQNIISAGEAKKGASRSFLSKIGALGTTIEGSPVETGLGQLSNIQDKVVKARQEEENNLANAIATADTAMEGKIKARIEELNKLSQTNFDNALKVVKADQEAGSNRYTTLGNNIFDTKTGEFIMGPEQATTTSQKDYEYYKKQEETAGRTPLTFDDWSANAKAPAAVKEYMAAQKAGFTGSILEYQEKKKGVGTILDADTLNFMAQQYIASPGSAIPSFGMGVAGMNMRAQFYAAVAQQAEAQGLAGQALAAKKAGATAAQSALTLQQKLTSATQAAEGAAIKNLDLAYNLGQEYDRSGQYPAANRFLNWLNGQTGNTQLSAFEVALYTGAREYAKVASGAAGSISGLTDSATKEAEKLVNAAMTQGQLKSTLDTMKADMKNVNTSQQDSIENLKNIIAGTTTPTPTPTGNDFNNVNEDEMKQLRESFPGMTDEEIKKQLGFNNVGADTNQGANSGLMSMRTDRHNNPTAFTTDIASIAGLKPGVDYSKGDSFTGSDGKTYYTAKLLGDPIDTTIKVIDSIGFQTASGQPRWSYINMSKATWDSMTDQQKKNVIKGMYQQEGGSGLNKIFA